MSLTHDMEHNEDMVHAHTNRQWWGSWCQ